MNHEMIANPDHDEAVRMQYVVALKRRILDYSEGNRGAVEGRAGDAYEAREGRRPQSWIEIGEALSSDPFYQVWSAISRSSQDVMWRASERTVDRELPRLKQAAQRLGNRPSGGSLDIPDHFVLPDDAHAADIHGQPGGYLRDGDEGGFFSGALYETGGRVFANAYSRNADQSMVGPAIHVLKQRYPDFAPRAILDMGCSAGGSTFGLQHHYASADEVHGIDVGEGLVRYAHLAAEAQSKCVNFHQMDAGNLNFPDESFDLVFGALLLHEASPAKNADILSEARRVLKPGGFLVFQDVPIKAMNYDAYQRFYSGWQTSNNDEPFWDLFLDTDFAAMMRAAGFAADNVHETNAPMFETGRAWYLLIGEKPTAEGSIGKV